MTLSRRAIIGFLGVPVLAGCSPIDFKPAGESTPSSAEPAEGLPRVVEPGYFRRSPTGVKVELPEPKPVGLVVSTPHFDAMVSQTLTTTELPLEVAKEFDETSPLQAPEGHVLFACLIQSGSPLFTQDGEDPVEVFLQINNEPIRLPGIFGGLQAKNDNNNVLYQSKWECILVCIRKEDVLTLQINDEGKSLVVDLLNGVPNDDEAWRSTAGIRQRRSVKFNPANGVSRRKFEAHPAGFEASQGELAVGLQPGAAVLTSWNPVHGWATPERMWLTMSMETKVEYKDLPAVIDLDLPNCFTFTGSGGAAARLVQPSRINTEDLIAGRTKLIPTFEVAESDASAVLVFVPNGNITVDFQQVSGVPGVFTSAGEPIRFDMSFVEEAGRFEQ